MKTLLVFFALIVATVSARAAPCLAEDFETRISGETECLIMRRYGAERPATLLVWLHGNVSTGGPANSHFRVAEKAARDFAGANVLSVALVRPGYPDGTGAYSSGNDFGRADNWPRATVRDIGAAVERLRQRYAPQRLILIGHSGGAAISAVLLGMRPELADAAILIGCPCDMIAWRAGRSRRPWTSEDPMGWVAGVASATRVIALTGTDDVTTLPALAESYVSRLAQRGLHADFRLVFDAGHIDILGSPAITEALQDVILRERLQ